MSFVEFIRHSNFSGAIKSHLKILKFTIILLALSFQTTNGANVLFFNGAGSHSHRVALQPLATKLAEKGHKVTFFSPIKPEVENSNITEFCPQALSEFNDEMTKYMADGPVIARLQDRNYDEFLLYFGFVAWYYNHFVNEMTVKGSDFQVWMEKSSFDLVITEHPCKEIALGIAHKFGAKVIAFSPTPLFMSEPDIMGIPTESSWYPYWTLKSPYSFIPDRFYHEYNVLGWYFTYKLWYVPKMDSLLKEVFDKDTPSMEDLIKNISLYLLNTHFSSEYAKSLPPNVVPVGGMHVKDSKSIKPLPQNIKDFIETDESDGFIYISFGSIVRLSALPLENRNGFFRAISSFKNARFLMKWNEEIPEDMSENVLPLKWFPQQDLLAHPKCRGFVSQGGLMSFQQATYNGIPVVIVPVFGDQPYNAETAVHQGIGIHLELADLNFDTVSDAINQLLYNETLSNTAKEVARRFKDRPMSPIDTAVWWTEYVLRHNDTTHLKPLGINQSWWQRRLLDFWAFVFASMFLSTFLLVFSVCRLIRLCRKSKAKSDDKLKKQ